MTERVKIERLLHGLYDARVNGDLGALCRSFSSDAVLRFSGAGQAGPTLVAAIGIGEFRPLLSLMIKSFKLREWTLLSMIVDNDKAAVHWRARIHSLITGVTTPTELVDLVAVRDGRVASYTEFFAPG